ncbi:Urb2 domain-containing protein, partial [Cephalotus follicularis]
SSSSSKKKREKRKLTNTEFEDRPKPLRTHRIDSSEKQKQQIEAEEEGGGGPWRNLQLILSIQNKQLNIEKKVELACDFVKSRVERGGSDMSEDFETVKNPLLIVFLNDWIQSLLISSDKKIGNIEACLDFRCWGIFKYCLEESLILHISLSFSRNLLRAIACVAKNALSLLKESFFGGQRFELYSVVIDCVSVVFSSENYLSNQNLDLWISTIDPVLQLALKIFAEDLEGGNAVVFVFRFSCLVLEPFAKFLRVHPPKKNGFQDFLDKLLEPMLDLLGVLHLQIDGSNPEMTRNLMKLIEEVLSHGLFHPIHIDGFLGLRSTDKYTDNHDGKPENFKTVIKSYHRHFFDKLERDVAAKKVQLLGGMGELFRLLVDRVKKQKGASLLPEGTKIGKAGSSQHVEYNLSGHRSEILSKSNSALQEKSFGLSNLNAEARKSLFYFFVQIMEPLLMEMNGYLHAKLKTRPALLDALCLIKSVNNLLGSLMHEKVYLRTEDTSEGVCFNFLKKAYNMIMSFASNLLCLSKCDIDEGLLKEMFPLLAREVIVAMGFFLDVEYQVIGNDLISLWLMVFSYLAIVRSFIHAPEQCSLTSPILNLGCQLIKLYSELRQVENIIFALCKAIRVKICSNGELNDASYLSCSTSLHYGMYARSIGILLCSPEFKLAIHNAIKSIPEGQASGCIGQLTVDLSESLEWMKIDCSVADGKDIGKVNLRHCNKQGFDVQAELLGRGLSEMYAVVLDSLTVTTGNSNLLGLSLKDLMTVVRPYLSSLVGLQPVGVNEFLLSVTGRTFDKFEVFCHWVFVFFFRLYMSFRSLYRQVISLMPPVTSRKMSALMGDSFTAYSGRDLIEKTEWTGDDYFSWIVQPSASLLSVIHSVSDYFQKSFANCCSLIYVLNAMAIQRLVDLNRQIKSLEYLLQNNDSLVQTKLLFADAGLSLYRKRSRQCKRRISDMKEEAAGLTQFMLDYLSLLNNDQSPISNLNHVNTCVQAPHESDMWDMGVCELNEKSLPTAIWWIFCQNIDIWCDHASKKKSKMFLSILICSSLPSATSSCGRHHFSEASQLNKVTVHNISWALLSDSILYEQKFVRRHFASRFCHILKKLALPVFSGFSVGAVDFKSLPNWAEVLRSLEDSSMLVSTGKLVTHNGFLKETLMSCSSDDLLREICWKQQAFPFTACQSLLSLLGWIPKGYLKSKSISLYATYILNLERLLVGTLLDCGDVLSSHKHYQLLRLFLSCRKSLKCIIDKSCEETTEACLSSLGPILSEVPFFALWLFKSVSLVVGLREAMSGYSGHEVRDMIFSLLDLTSYVFLMLTKYQSTYAVLSCMISEKPEKEQSSSDVAYKQKNLNKSDHSADSSKDIEAWKGVLLLADSLKEQTQILFVTLKDAICDEKKGLNINALKLNKLSSIISCFSGFLWGLASSLNHTDATDSHRAKMLRRKREAVSKLEHCIYLFADFISSFLHMLVVEDDKQPGKLCDAHNSHKLEMKWNSLGSAMIDDNSGNNVRGCSSQLNYASCAASVLSEVNSHEQNFLNMNILQSLLRGDHPEVAFALRELFFAYSAILSLNLQIGNTSLFSLVPLFTSISQVLLSELAETAEIPQSYTFVWLDGVLKYLEELGSHFPLTNPTLTRNLYANLIELHLRALGKCISLQGKKATLASHETESSTKMLQGHIGISEASLSNGCYWLEEFKNRLRMSFKVLIRKPSELHLLSAIHAIERALVGVQEHCTTVYEIQTGCVDGGKVSSIVAAGIDCLDLVLEYVSGHKRLSVVKRHMHNLIAGLFSIILHLQSPLIFYGRSIGGKFDNCPDSGAVVLMSVEVLTRVSGKHALFRMDSWHVGHCLRIPGVLFQDFLQLRPAEASIPSNFLLLLDNKDNIPAESLKSCIVDRPFSIELFAACCRLLYTVLKHHKSDCEGCVALLEESTRVLLLCLETMHSDLVVMKSQFSWDAQERVKCACFLRRIYEEIRQQKDVFGPHSFKFLSSYIWVYSGYGPLKSGIRREIDEALKPGVYALIDACSADNLQYLHTVFGEGPCRNTLANLQHDYKLNFQYEGKV